MPNDQIQDLARIFATIVEVHGVKVAVESLPQDVQAKLNQYFMDELLRGWQTNNTDAPKS